MHSPAGIVVKLCQVKVLPAQGKPMAEAVRAIAVNKARYFWWRAGFGGLKLDRTR